MLLLFSAKWCSFPLCRFQFFLIAQINYYIFELNSVPLFQFMSLKTLIIHASFCLSSISIILLSHLTLVLFLFPSACFFFSSLCVSYCVSTGSFLRCFFQVCLHFCDAMMNYCWFLPELCLYSHFVSSIFLIL